MKNMDAEQTVHDGSTGNNKRHGIATGMGSYFEKTGKVWRHV